MTAGSKYTASLLWCCLALCSGVTGQGMSASRPPGTAILQNTGYTLIVQPDATIVVENKDGSRQPFLLHFTVFYRETDPHLGESYSLSLNSILPSWDAAAGGKPRSSAYYAAGRHADIAATATTVRGRTISCRFPADSLFTLSASLTLPLGSGEPRLAFRLLPKRKGWYSVGYTGAASIAPAQVTGLLQPLIWEERRFPDSSYLSMEHMCPIPAALVETGGSVAVGPASTSIPSFVTGIAADPASIPFRMATLANAGFGVLVRNENGEAQPQLFAPVLGGAGSQMQPGQSYSFSLRLVVRRGSWLDACESLSRGLYRFHDYRENATASLNQTIDNMVALAMNDTYSGWNADLKAFDYSTDVRGTVKLVSALHPLSIAIIRDNPEIYRRRALPMTEFLLSREKYLFTEDEGETNQQPSHFLRGPAAEVSELSALYAFSQARSPVLSHYALELYDRPRALNLDIVQPAHSWPQALALFRMTHKQAYLDSALAGAIRYCAARIAQPATDFRDAHLGDRNGGQFWTDFSPKWFDLLELYEETRDGRLLDAAAYGARIYATHAWMQPVVPAGETLVNPGGVLPMGDPWNKSHPQPMKTPALLLPAWRVSPVGLMPEASNTYNVNPAVLLAPYAAFFLRLADYTGDPYLHDIARSAVVGRYTNYPGYDINLAYTNIYQLPDYPLRDWHKLTYNQIYYNHIWPQIAFLTDYLVTEAGGRSAGRILFPAQYAEGYAYLHCRVYGDRAGRFYGDDKVWLWMPEGLLHSDNIQVNYVAARGNGSLYLALLNQSRRRQRVRLRLDPNVVPIDIGKRYSVTVWESPAGKATQRTQQADGSLPVRPTGKVRTRQALLVHGELTLTVDSLAITALRISGVPIRTRLQDAVLDSTSQALGANSYGQWPLGQGKVTGMLLSMGRELTSAYIWLDATEKQLSAATLHYRTATGWMTQQDDHYPYEFTLPIADGQKELECWIEGKGLTGTNIRTDTIRLER